MQGSNQATIRNHQLRIKFQMQDQVKQAPIEGSSEQTGVFDHENSVQLKLRPLKLYTTPASMNSSPQPNNSECISPTSKLGTYRKFQNQDVAACYENIQRISKLTKYPHGEILSPRGQGTTGVGLVSHLNSDLQAVKSLKSVSPARKLKGEAISKGMTGITFFTKRDEHKGDLWRKNGALQEYLKSSIKKGQEGGDKVKPSSPDYQHYTEELQTMSGCQGENLPPQAGIPPLLQDVDDINETLYYSDIKLPQINVTAHPINQGIQDYFDSVDNEMSWRSPRKSQNQSQEGLKQQQLSSQRQSNGSISKIKGVVVSLTNDAALVTNRSRPKNNQSKSNLRKDTYSQVLSSARGSLASNGGGSVDSNQARGGTKEGSVTVRGQIYVKGSANNYRGSKFHIESKSTLQGDQSSEYQIAQAETSGNINNFKRSSLGFAAAPLQLNVSQKEAARRMVKKISSKIKISDSTVEQQHRHMSQPRATKIPKIECFPITIRNFPSGVCNPMEDLSSRVNPKQSSKIGMQKQNQQQIFSQVPYPSKVVGMNPTANSQQVDYLHRQLSNITSNTPIQERTVTSFQVQQSPRSSTKNTDDGSSTQGIYVYQTKLLNAYRIHSIEISPRSIEKTLKTMKTLNISSKDKVDQRLARKRPLIGKIPSPQIQLQEGSKSKFVFLNNSQLKITNSKMQVGRIASFSTDPNQSEYDKTFDKGGNLSPWESQKVGGVNFKKGNIQNQNDSKQENNHQLGTRWEDTINKRDSSIIGDDEEEQMLLHQSVLRNRELKLNN